MRSDLPAQIAPTVRSPLKVGEMRSLMEVFEAMHDPRQLPSRRYSLPLMLMLVCMGLLCGAKTLNGIVRYVKLLSQPQRRALRMRKKKGQEFYGVPCYNAFRELLAALDIAEIQNLLTTWLTQHEGQLPRTLAVDGKDLGKNLGIIVTLINTTYAGSGEKEGHEYDGTSTPAITMRCGDTGHEMKLVQEILESPAVDLVGAVVTGDALQCQHETLHTIVVEKGGDFMITIKDNQPKAASYARKMLEGTPLFF